MSNDVQELRSVLEVINAQVPQLLRSIRDTFFSAEAGKEFGEALGTFYASLVENGIPQDQALELTRAYMSTVTNLSNVVQRHAK